MLPRWPCPTAPGNRTCVVRLLVVMMLAVAGPLRGERAVYPGSEWTAREPSQAGLAAGLLEQVAGYLGGRGMVVRHGFQVFAWGDVARRADIASAAKPFYTHFLLHAVESGRLEGVDTPLAVYEPRLRDLNPGLGYKDRRITFRHGANQISCYGVEEAPGAAFDYNDFQMTLLWQTLVRGVYGLRLEEVDGALFRPRLADRIGCQDQPTMLAFGAGDRPGRVAISVRDHCRFGLLYLRQGVWPGERGDLVALISSNHVAMATRSPLPLSLPRTRARAAGMIPGQPSLGSRRVPDDQTDHLGCYSWLWWVNGVRASGRRLWPEAPADAFAALGHEHGKRGLVVLPSLDLVMAWNDSTLDRRPWMDPALDPHPLNEALRLLVAAVAAAGGTNHGSEPGR